MDIEGTIVMDLDLQEGISKAGNPWKKKEWVLETFGQYPKKVKFHVFGDQRIQALNFEIGKAYRISIDLESREFNGRWYTDVSAYASAPIEGGMPGAMGAPAAASSPAAPPFGTPSPAAPMTGEPMQDPFGSSANETDDLPF